MVRNRALSELIEQSREPPPSHGGEVPREAQRSDRKLRAAEKVREIAALEETDEDEAFAEVGMCNTDYGDEKRSTKQE